MGYYLTIDQGNTRTKATILNESRSVVCRGVHDTFDIETLEDCYGSRYELEGIIYSSVSHIDVRLIESMRNAYPERIMVLTHQSDTGVKVCYDTPQTLGCDRVAAIAGASALYPGKALLVVDAGTAITIDIADTDGTFRGGNISAGISLRMNALHTATASLPQVMPEGEVPQFGHDTVTAIRSGAVMGTAREVERSFAKARKIYGCSKVVLTGGDAELLAQHLELPAGTVCLQPDLQAQGLYSILQRMMHQQQ